MTNEERTRNIQAQIVSTQGYITYWNAMVVSGGYKQRKTTVGYGSNEDRTMKFRDMTDEEKLEDTLATLLRHVKRVWELTDALMMVGNE
jgi:hypothetical protein